MKAVRHYNNIAKRQLISALTKKKVVLDIGSGRGGDLAKYYYAGVSKLYLTEPDGQNLSELKRRLLQCDPKFQDRVTTLQCKGEQLINMDIPKVDVVSMFFCLTFFNLPDIVASIDNILKPGGRLIGITIDGDQIKKVMDSSIAFPGNYFDCSLFTVTREWDDSKLTDKVKFTVKSNTAIVRPGQRENMADFPKFVELLKESGINLESSRLCSGSSLEHQDQKTFAQLNRIFVFKRS